jgi:ornithine carbamoyltransferase
MTALLATTRHPGSLLKELDLTEAQFEELLDSAGRLKADKAAGTERRRLSGKNVALIFEKASTRTRCAFEVAAHQQGAHVTYLGPDGSHIGTEESIPDTARVLGRMFDAIEFRGVDQSTVEELADSAGPPEEISYCYLGDGRNNVARSLLVTGALLGMDVRVAAPPGLQPPADVVDTAQALAVASGARILVTDDVHRAVRGAQFLYTDVWVSRGESDDHWASRGPELLPYRVTAGLVAATGRPGTVFMHCLPAVHDADTDLGAGVQRQFGVTGAEVGDEVFESAASIVFDQAENRLHTIEAVLVRGLG